MKQLQADILSIMCLFLLFSNQIYADVSDAVYDSLSMILTQYQSDIEEDSVVRQRLIENRMALALVPYSKKMEYHISSDISHLTYIKKIVVIVKENIFLAMPSYVYRYAHDINNAYGCEVYIYSVSGETEVDIKALLIENSSNLSGAVFIGNIIPAYYRNEKMKVGESEWAADTWPCDLYYMDLDGQWGMSNDGSGIYVTHTGNVQPEIFVGRINTAGMGRNEIQELKNYLDRNHNYWTGKKALNKRKALTFTQKDWNNSDFWNSVSPLYGSTNYDVVRAYFFTKALYINCLQNSGYEFIQLACHSDPTQHFFAGNDPNTNNLSFSDIAATPKNQIGYNLFCCNACRWTSTSTSPCLGESYLYGLDNNSATLALIGSTKTGSMLGFSYFYEPLGAGKCIGEATKQWWINNCGSEHSTYEKLWHYGLSILGDPLISYTFSNVCEDELVIDKGVETKNSSYYAQSEIVVQDYSIMSNVEVTMNAPHIRITGPFRCVSPAKFTTNVNDYCVCNSSKKNLRGRPSSYDNLVEKDKSVIIYPNPVQDILFVESSAEIEMYNIHGQCLLHSTQSEINVSALPQGIYILRVTATNGNVYQEKIIKQ